MNSKELTLIIKKNSGYTDQNYYKENNNILIREDSKVNQYKLESTL